MPVCCLISLCHPFKIGRYIDTQNLHDHLNDACRKGQNIILLSIISNIVTKSTLPFKQFNFHT